MSVEVTGILSLLWLVITVWVIIRVVQSPASTGKKTFWVVLILLVPLVGIIGWFLIGKKN
ncbi:MAG: PLDc N-terminal domain-containing protein [Granulosicoccus sp.]